MELTFTTLIPTLIKMFGARTQSLKLSTPKFHLDEHEKHEISR